MSTKHGCVSCQKVACFAKARLSRHRQAEFVNCYLSVLPGLYLDVGGL